MHGACTVPEMQVEETAHQQQPSSAWQGERERPLQPAQQLPGASKPDAHVDCTIASTQVDVAPHQPQ